MKILICCATPGELKSVKNSIKALKLKQSLPIHYLCTGIGNYETIFNLTSFLTQQQESDFFIVNIGICGYWSQENQKGKLIQIGRIKNQHNEKEILTPIPFKIAPIHSIWSGDTILMQAIDDNDGFCDMESRAIELVADKFKFPRVFLKVPYDAVGEETKNFDKKEACNLLDKAIDYEELITKLLKLI